MSGELRANLIDLGMAVGGAEYDRASRRHSMRSDSDPSQWIGVDQRLAGIYMCVLADELSRMNSLSPVTDQPLAHVAVGGWSTEDVANILLSSQFVTRSRDPHGPVGDRASLVAYLALDLAIPKDLSNVPVSQIIAFRQRHADELFAFQATVGTAVSDLEALGTSVDEAILSKYAKEIVAKYFASPRRELDRALRASGLDTTLATLTVQTSLPALAAGGALGATVSPTIGVGVGVAVGLASIGARTRKDRAEQRGKRAAADYLLRLERELKPGGSIKRSLQTVLGR
ncbi:DUF6236 family protein [Geodermatophilus sp. SYSU D00710]